MTQSTERGSTGVRHSFQTRLLSTICTAVLVAAMSPAAHPISPMLLQQELPNRVYFENAGRIYRVDLQGYNETVSGYAAGSGTVTIEVTHLVFRGSKAAASFWKPGEEFVHLGSEPEFVNQITGYDISRAVREESVIVLSLSRDSRFVASDISVGEDRIAVRVQQAFFRDPAVDGIVGSLTINGAAVDVSAVDARQLLAVTSGRLPSDEASVSPAIARLVSRIKDPSGFARGIAGFTLATRKFADVPFGVAAGSAHKNRGCSFECTGCALGLAGLGASVVALAATACGAVVGCLIWGAGFSISMAGAGLGCASCLDCVFGSGGGGGGVQCPLNCGTSGAPACPDGCCLGGTPEPAGGCGDDDDECDPDIDSCECQLGYCFP